MINTSVKCAFAFSALAVAGSLIVCRVGAQQPKNLDPAAWGTDHVGQPVPEYLTGDECLFCHRNDVGPTWSSNRHAVTMHLLEPADPMLPSIQKSVGPKIAGEINKVLGGKGHARLLKSSEVFGKVDILSSLWSKSEQGGAFSGPNPPTWDVKKFGDACAGCHATAVDSTARTFSAPSLDCYVCHGLVDPKHSKDSTLVHLSKKRNDNARIVTSLCAQCHVRTGHSRSSKLPYPNNFVAGDNLFRDFSVDFGPTALAALNPGDRHVLENVRDVVIRGQEEVTCLSCHDVHKQSTRKHHKLVKSELCLNCHQATGSMKVRKAYEVHSKTCEY